MYTDKYGVEFSDNLEILYKCPKNFKGGYIIPEGVKKISGGFWYDKRGYHYGAFEENQFIETIVIPSSVTEIGDRAFFGTRSLKHIYVDGANKNFCSKDGILYNKEKTELIWCPQQYFGPLNIDRSVRNISCSIGNAMIDSICVADGNKHYTIKDDILYDKKLTTLVACPKLKYGVIEIPVGIKNIKSCAFKNCLALKTVIIPDSVLYIGSEAFCGCSALENVKLPNAKTIIGYHCFERCTALPEITIPPYVHFEEVGFPLEISLFGTFTSCTRLFKITFLEGREEIDGDCADECIFYNCTAIHTVYFPKSLKTLSIHCWGESISKVLVPIGEKKRFLQMLDREEESIRKRFRDQITKETESYLRTIQKYKDCIREVNQ